MFVSVISIGAEMFIPERTAHTDEVKFAVAQCRPVLFSGSISVWHSYSFKLQPSTYLIQVACFKISCEYKFISSEGSKLK